MHRIRTRRRVIAATLIAALAASTSVIAQTGLRDVVITANRYEAEADSVPATVTSLNRETMDRRLPADTADLFADEPDVAMARDQRRFGATRVNIRGIEDNRVVQMVDGVRLPDYYNGGGPTNYTMNASPTAMTDFLKRVEVVRGAASSLYGSDAIGGVVGFVTLDPSDLIAKDEAQGGRYRLTYTGQNGGLSQSLLGALRGDAGELLIGYAHARTDETDNKGGTGGLSASRTDPNPQKAREDGLLAKFVIRPGAGHKLTATAEARDQSAQTDILRMASSLPRVSWMRGDDNVRRIRGSLEWEHKATGMFYDRLTARIYRQDSDTKNYNFQRRTGTTNGCSASTAGANNCYIEQDFFFTQETTGGGVQAEKLVASGSLSHLITSGIDLSRTRVEELRDGRIWSDATGFTKSLAGETFPARDFAIGRTDTTGLFLQDEIAGLAEGRLVLVPGIRYDLTKLKPEMDTLAQQVLTTIGRQAAEQSNSSVSPKLAATWKVSEAVSTYGQISRGFRAPNYNEVNGAFRNATQLYAVVPNPDLRPETSVGGEVGLRYAAANQRSQVAVFDNRYRDFIDSIQLTCPGDARCYNPGGGYRTNISVNLSRVRIYGLEARGSWEFLPGWRADGAFAFAQGTNTETKQPINTVEPTRLSLALAREAGAWGAEARLRAAAKKSRVDDTGGTWFRTPGYGVVDLSAWTRIDRNLRATVALNNLFDRKYWLWSDIRQADARNPTGVDFYSQPGRNLSVALQADF
jgi:hemoglobin/transferrin/lactoferrin receptor protein